MVVGNGLIAKSFTMFNGEKNIVIFASGVSDSKCIEVSEFERERNLLLSMDRTKKIVYFSTYSISDGSEKNEYIKHKIHMEFLVENNFEDWLILRLPTVVGYGGNDKNFFNYISSRLKDHLPINVYESTYRSLIDVDDLLPLTKHIIHNFSYLNIDVSLDNQTLVTDIVNEMINTLESKSDVYLIKCLGNLPVDNTQFKSICKNFTEINKFEYNSRLIKKYILNES
jgi:UDP-2-acetamido-2,6-beta-L-arabino-hexul-4-ose reductase